MWRGLSVLVLLTLSLTLSGCGSHNSELPASKTEQPKPTPQQNMERAMQGMPPEMQKKMAPQLERMKQQQRR